jgi:hypothetical protein
VLAGASGKGAEIQIPTNSIQAVAVSASTMLPDSQPTRLFIFVPTFGTL